jgi:hypothetical protein
MIRRTVPCHITQVATAVGLGDYRLLPSGKALVGSRSELLESDAAGIKVTGASTATKSSAPQCQVQAQQFVSECVVKNGAVGASLKVVVSSDVRATVKEINGTNCIAIISDLSVEADLKGLQQRIAGISQK